MKEIYKRTLKLAVPMMIQNGISNGVALVDNVMVGQLGTNVVTGVSIVGQLLFVFNLAIFGGLSGPGIYAAQFFGQNNTEGFRRTFRIKHWICGIILVLGLAAFIFADEPLINLYLKGEGSEVDPVATMNYAKEYLSIMLIGLFPFAFTQIYASGLREAGHSVLPMTAGLISVGVDILFNYLLIFGKMGFPALGAKGAAIATVAARIVEMLIVVIFAFANRKKFDFLQGIYKTLLVPKDITLKIIKKGLPIFLNEFLWSAGIAAMTQAYSRLGLDNITGLNISNSLCNMLNTVFVALGTAVGIVIGQELGASKFEEARSDAFRLTRFTAILSSFLMVVLFIAAPFFPLVYKTSAEIRSLATWFIIITALFFPVQGYVNGLYFTIRSGGKTMVTFLFDSVFTWVVVIPITYLLCSFASLPVLAIYAIVQALDITKVIVGRILIKKGVWISNIAEE